MTTHNLIQPLISPEVLSAASYAEKKKTNVTLKRKIVVKDNNGCVFLNFDNIIYLEAQGAYTKVFLTNKEPLLVSKNIKSFGEKLNESEFVRIHKSFIININHMSGYNRNSGSTVTLSNGEELPVAVRRKEEFEMLLEGMLV